MLDTILNNGHIIDGSGNVWFKADVGVRAGRIAQVGNLQGVEAGRTLDCTGLVVCPGFIDVHTHSEFPILINPQAESSLRMGATTHVVGNCGSSAGPLRPDGDKLLEALLSNLEPEWTTLGEYFAYLEGRGTAINMASLVGHGTVRSFVMGDDFARPSTPEELEQMKRLVAQAMEEGAMGLSSGLVFSPGRFAETSEVIELCKVATAYGGVYATHVRSQGDQYAEAIAEAIEICEKSGIAVHLAHQGAMTPHWGKSAEYMRAVSEARERGVDVTIDIIGGVEGVGSLNDMFPLWTAEGGLQEQLKRFQDPALRQRIKWELEGETNWNRNNPALLVREGRWDLFGPHQSKDPSMVGKTFAQLAEIQGKDPYDVLLDHLVEEGEPRGTLEIVMSEEDTYDLGALPFTMFTSDVWPVLDEGPLGASAAYPTQYGAFPWVFRKLVREEKVITLEEAVQKMTSLPAQRFGLWDRGLIREGLWADILVFDAERIADKGTWENPRQFPAGIEYVLVNGEIVIDREEHTGAIPGKVLKH